MKGERIGSLTVQHQVFQRMFADKVDLVFCGFGTFSPRFVCGMTWRVAELFFVLENALKCLTHSR